jgi:hypothetical protein
LEDLLGEAYRRSGIELTPYRFMHLSHIIFRSGLKLGSLNSALLAIAAEIAKSISEDYKEKVHVEPSLISFGADVSQIKLTPAPFTIDRRAGVPFSEGMYFSSAPLRTHFHLQLIERFERLLS